MTKPLSFPQILQNCRPIRCGQYSNKSIWPNASLGGCGGGGGGGGGVRGIFLGVKFWPKVIVLGL